MRALLLTCTAILACACWPAAAQDETTDAPDVATDQPPTATTPPPPPGINPNHSYYPPTYRPHFSGYYPNSYWNRYPSNGYTPSRPWYYRPPAYHPPPTTYEWWRQFNRRPSFEHGGWNGGAHGGTGGYGYLPSSGYGYMQPYYTSSWWQPYYLAVGYYRRSSSPASHGYNYPNYGGQNGGSGSGSGYPYVSGYDRFGYPYYRSGYYGGGLYGGQSGYGGYSRSYGCYSAGCGGYMPYYPYQGGSPSGGSSYGSYPYATGYGSYPYYMSAHAGQPSYGGGSSYYGSGHGTYYGYGGGQAAQPPYSPGYYSPQGYGYGNGYSSGYPYYNYGSSYPNYGYGGYSTGKYTGSGSYPYGYFGSNSPGYQRYHSPGSISGWYDCIYYPTAVNKGYAISGSVGVKQKIDVTKQSTEKVRKTFTRRSIRELIKSSEDSSVESRRANDRGPTFDLSNDGLGGGMRLLAEGSSAKKGTPTSLSQTSSTKTEAFGEGSGDNDKRITAEMVESFERRLTAMNRMFEELLTPNDMQENGDYFSRRVRTYRRLLNQMQQHRGTGLGPSSNDVDSQDILRQLRAIENELDDHRRRALRTLYHALTDSDLTVSDKLKVLATVYDFAKGDLSEEGAEIAGSTERSVISSESEASKPSRENDDSMTDEDGKQFYEKLEKFLETIRSVESSSSDEGTEDMPSSTTLPAKYLPSDIRPSSSESSSSESSSSEEAGSGDRTKFELKGSVSLAVDVEGKSNLGSNSIGTLMKTMLS
ncbi:uncharacterized protein LOC144123605 [Amblyomma americanum]